MHENFRRHFASLVNENYFRRLRTKFPEMGQVEFRQHLTEVLKYLYLASQTERLPFYGAPRLHQIWQEMILQTKDYLDLCESLPGAKYVHRDDPEVSKPSPANTDLEPYAREIAMYATYVRHYGGFSEEGLLMWPRAAVLKRSWDLADARSLNVSLKSILRRRRGQFKITVL